MRYKVAYFFIKKKKQPTKQKTNDLYSAKNDSGIASNVMELEDICKRLNTDIIASEIVSCGDEPNGKKRL